MRDVVIAFRRRAIALLFLRAGRMWAERDAVSFEQPPPAIVKMKLALALF